MRVVLILLSVVLIAKESNAWVIDVAPRIKAFAGKAMCTGIAISICLSPVHATAAEFAGSYSGKRNLLLLLVIRMQFSLILFLP